MTPRKPHRPSHAPAWVVGERATSAVSAGHPWLYREAFVGRNDEARAGDVVDVVDRSGAFVARAIVDPASALFARVVTRDEHERVDDALVSRRLAAALALRRQWVGGDTTAYRLCHGEGDGLPGLVIDRYEDVAVLRPDGAAASAWAERAKGAIVASLTGAGVRSVVLRDRAKTPGGAGPRGTTWWGQDAPPKLFVREHGMRLEVDLAQGQKTGAFLDQRENRRRVRDVAGGRRVLNLFSYAGGFSVAAALGGAENVTSVDIAAGGHASAARSMRENGLDPSPHAFVTADVFVFLDAARARGESWGLIISDPPSFAPNEKSKPRALAAYRSLHAECVRVLAPGGIFCASSCSSHVNEETFLTTLDARSLGGASLRVCASYGNPPDHPTTPAWAEGRYLKFVVLALTPAGFDVRRWRRQKERWPRPRPPTSAPPRSAPSPACAR